MGVTIVKLFLGLSSFTQSYSAQALLPIMYGGSNGDVAPLLLLGWWVFIKEILVTALFVLGLLVLPQVFIINHLPRQYTFACLLPLMLIRLSDQTPAFAPATLFSLWFTSRDTLRAVHGMTSIQYEHGECLRVEGGVGMKMGRSEIDKDHSSHFIRASPSVFHNHSLWTHLGGVSGRRRDGGVLSRR
jgi:hypothetical protein